MFATLVRSFGDGRLPAALRRSLCTVGKVADDVGERKPLHVTLIEGQGSGPETCAAVQKIVEAAGVPVFWDWRPIKLQKLRSTGTVIVNEDLLSSARTSGRVLRGPELDTAWDGAHGSVVLALNKALKTTVGVRVFTSFKGLEPYGTINMVNVRDNVTGLYSEIEHTAVPGVVQAIKKVTLRQSELVAKYAFQYAAEHGMERVTALHKADVMRMSDLMYLRGCRLVSCQFPDVEYVEEKLDTFALRVTETPWLYGVVVTTSLYGAFASGICAGLCGGPAGVPTAAYGSGVSVYGPMGHAGTINPTGLIRSAVMMLKDAGMVCEAERIHCALLETYKQGVRTRDTGGDASCSQFTDAVINNL